MAKVVFDIPHDRNGNQVSYSSWNEEKYNRPYYEFEAVLTYDGFQRGRSALNIIWRDENGKTYESGMGFLDDHLRNGGGNKIMGKFGFKKQGTSVLLKLIQ